MKRVLQVSTALALTVTALALCGMAISFGRARAFREIGWRRLATGEVAAAVGAFGRAVSARVDDADALRGLGESSYVLWRRQPSSEALRAKAVDAFGRAVKESPADLTSRVRLLHLGILGGVGSGAPAATRFDSAAGIAGGHPDNRRVQRCFLDLALDAASVPALRAALFSDPARRLPVVKVASFLASLGEVGLKDVEPLLGDPFGKGEFLSVVSGSAKVLREFARRFCHPDANRAECADWLVLAAKGDDNRFHLEVARQLAAGKRHAEALEVLAAWLAAHPDDVAALRRAVALAPANGGFRRALERLEGGG